MKKQSLIMCMLFSVISCLCLAQTLYAVSETMQHFKTKNQCLSCHGKPSYSITHNNQNISLYVDIKKFKKSAHGEFECSSCHDTENKHFYGRELTDKISQKCANCHTGAAFDYNRSVHKNDSTEKPNCVSCHGSHFIESNTALSQTCAKNCHKVQYEQYTESFHGKAVALGGKNAPSCTYCHGYHKILSKKDPISLTTANKKYILCARCHQGQSLGVGSIEHYQIKPEGSSKPVYFVKSKMPWLIIVVMTVFLLHTILDILHRIRSRHL